MYCTHVDVKTWDSFHAEMKHSCRVPCLWKKNKEDSVSSWKTQEQRREDWKIPALTSTWWEMCVSPQVSFMFSSATESSGCSLRWECQDGGSVKSLCGECPAVWEDSRDVLARRLANLGEKKVELEGEKECRSGWDFSTLLQVSQANVCF